MDGHSWWPLFENIPTEYLESYYPLRIDRYASIQDSGGAGFHRGGNGIEKVYVYLEPGEVSLHDDRWLTYPWGILGGKPGRRSQKILLRKDGGQHLLPSKRDMIEVEPGDRIIYRTAGGGGWKDPLDRPPEKVQDDVRKGLVSRQKAADDYGVILTDTLEIEETATGARRAELQAAREVVGGIKDFDFGPPLEEILAHAHEETGLEPPRPPRSLSWVPLESPEEARQRVRKHGGGQTSLSE
jgi:N-methylhydantoinase B